MSQGELAIAHAEVSAEERQMILATLRLVLESPHFCKSKRYPSLLEFVVHNALEENSHVLKERTVGVEVFGRMADYDTSTDPVVRVAAGEVRRRMAAYFSEHPEAPVRIDIPPGSYRAEFCFRPPAVHERLFRESANAGMDRFHFRRPTNTRYGGDFARSGTFRCSGSPIEQYFVPVDHKAAPCDCRDAGARCCNCWVVAASARPHAAGLPGGLCLATISRRADPGGKNGSDWAGGCGRWAERGKQL